MRAVLASLDPTVEPHVRAEATDFCEGIKRNHGENWGNALHLFSATALAHVTRIELNTTPAGNILVVFGPMQKKPC